MISNIYRLGLKKLFLRVFFLGQVIFFLLNFLFGSGGLLSLNGFKRENMVILSKITAFQEEINKLNKHLQCWKSDSFLKEKMAREELQMARPGDEIYIL